MRFLATRDEMQRIDLISINQIGIPGLVLMERAALAVTEEVEKRFPGPDKNKTPAAGNTDIRILVVTERGNNGGDGLAVARMLTEKGYQTDIYCIGQVAHATESYRIQEKILGQMGVRILEDFPNGKYDVIVDAIFGVGLKRNIEGLHKEVIEHINDMPSFIVAVDIPSGISATTGRVMNVAVRADITVTMGLEKAGMMLYPGHEYCGEILVKEIGFPEKAVNIVMPEIFTYDSSDLSRLKKRRPDGNKGTFGKVAVIAGSSEISGAACLAASAAYHVGSGMVKVYTHKDNRTILGGYLPEALMMTYQDEASAVLCAENACSWADVILIGPGIGTGKEAECMLQIVLENSRVPVVIDADGLNLLAEHIELLKAGKEKRQDGRQSLILTPHVKEMSRLNGRPVREIKEGIVAVCQLFAEEHSLVCVLKDARTCVSEGGIHTYMNTSGNDGMAVAGSGDVLAGMIAGLLATGLAPVEAARLGTYIHGLAGDQAKEHHGKAAMTSGDLIDEIGMVISQYV